MRYSSSGLFVIKFLIKVFYEISFTYNFKLTMRSNMKKIVYILSVIFCLLSLSNCHQRWWEIGGRGLYGQGDYRPPSTEGEETSGIIVGENGLILTCVGARPVDWIVQKSGTTERLNYVQDYPYSLEPGFLVVGDNGTVLYTTDGGSNWENRSISGLTKNLFGSAMFGGVGFPGTAVCGDDGIVCISTDVGSSWTQHNTITTHKLNSMMAYNSDIIVCVGDNGTIIRGNPQSGWENKSIASGVKFNRIFQGIGMSWSKLWVVGNDGAIYHSTNYGMSWGPQNSGTTTDLYDVKFNSADSGMVVGAGGVVRYTTNSGLTWLAHPYFDGLINGDIYSLSSVDTNTAFAIINNATLSKGSETLILGVSTEPFTDVKDSDGLTSAFHLEQNYPNPFNPSTNIQYAVRSSQFITLKIYDLLGREVATLVNEEKPAGTYEINFDAAGLSSGVYFYQLKAAEYIETKKFVLLK